MNDLEKQLNKIAEKIQKESQMKLSPDELFSDDFMSSNNINKSIQDIFNEAGVELSHIASTSEEEKESLSKVLSSTTFKSWDDFLYSAGQFQMKKKFKSLGWTK